MSLIIGIIFGKNDTVHYFDPAGIKLVVGDKIICNIEDGAKEIGEVVVPLVDISESDIISPLNRVIRKATYYDLSVDELNRDKEKKGFEKFNQLAKKYKLKMKLINVHVMFDKSKMIFYFTSEKRVDFREMVKDQNLPLNPFKISGVCGRLMCCLKYEYDSYKEFIENAPERGIKVKCSHGCGGVCGYEPLKKSIIVEFDNETRKSIPLSEVEITNERVKIKGDTVEESDTENGDKIAMKDDEEGEKEKEENN